MDNYENAEMQAIMDQERALGETEELKFYLDLGQIKHARDYVNMGNGTMIFFGAGTRDEWCPYVLRCADMKVAMPKDTVYFNMLRELAAVCGSEPLYLDIRHIFEHTSYVVNRRMVEHIAEMAKKYSYFGRENDVYRLFLHLYFGMVSEESYGRDWEGWQTRPQPSPFAGKLLKMLSVHKILREGEEVDCVANDCRGRKVTDILQECSDRLIYRF